MSADVPVPTNTLDPYAPEPTNVAPVRLRLSFLHSATPPIELAESVRVLTPRGLPYLVLGHGGSLFIARGTDERGVRLYRELPVLRLDRVPTRGEREAYQRGLEDAIVLAKGAAGKFDTRTKTAAAVLQECVIAPLEAMLDGVK